MLILDFASRDVAHACALSNHYINHTAVHFGLNPYSDQEFAASWAEGCTKYPWLAAEIDGAFAGFAKASRWREREAYQFTAEVGLYVQDAFHRRCVGKALYSELFDRLRARGFHTAVAGITMPNEASVRLHESLGFQRVGVFREVGRKFGKWHDTGWWQLMLV